MRLRVNNLLVAVSIIVATTSSCATNNRTDTTNAHSNPYDKLCEIFESGSTSNLNHTEMSELINKKVAQELSGTDAQATYQAMLMLNQEDRYSTVQHAASLQTGADWRCDAMQTLLAP
ncbi:MAG TPA: hypothetical protein VIC26_12660 [Marinagarivorans sp.]